MTVLGEVIVGKHQKMFLQFLNGPHNPYDGVLLYGWDASYERGWSYLVKQGFLRIGKIIGMPAILITDKGREYLTEKRRNNHVR